MELVLYKLLCLHLCFIACDGTWLLRTTSGGEIYSLVSIKSKYIHWFCAVSRVCGVCAALRCRGVPVLLRPGAVVRTRAATIRARQLPNDWFCDITVSIKSLISYWFCDITVSIIYLLVLCHMPYAVATPSNYVLIC